MKTINRLILTTVILVIFTACGGGGSSIPPPAPVPAAPVFYETSTGIFVSDSDGNNRIQLTPDFSTGDQYLNFAVSPNKQWVALSARLNGETRQELYVVSASGEHFTRVSVLSNAFSSISGETLLNDTAWSPNSDALIYVADDTHENRTEIFLVTINSDNTFNGPQKINGPIGTSGNVFVRTPGWSFDGSHIAYKVFDGSRTIGVNTHEVGTQSGDTNFSIRASKPAFSASEEVGGSYAWSPSANRLVYNGQVRSATEELFLVNASEDATTYAADDRVISAANGRVFFPNWSNDGRYVAYRTLATATEPANWSVYDSTVASPNAVKLVDDFGFITNFSWLANTNRISTYHNNGTGNLLTTINPDGSNRLEIPIQEINTNVTVSPDGSLIAVAETQSATSRYRLLFVSPTSTAIQQEIIFNSPTTDIDLSTRNSWSPANDRLLIIRTETGNTKILEQIDTSTGAATTLDSATDVTYIHQWAADASKVCAAKIDGATISDLLCLNPDGTEIVTITDDLNGNSDSFTFD